MSHIFISYSSEDSGFADLLESELRENDYTIWRDRSNLRSGDEWADQIEEALNNTWFLFVIVSHHSKKSRWVMKEVEHSRDRYIPIIPILIDGDIGFRLSDLQYIDFRDKGYTSLPDDVYEKLLEYAPKASIENDVPLDLLDGDSSERARLILKLRNISQNIRSPKALAARKYLEKLSKDEDNLVAMTARNALQEIRPYTLSLTQAKKTIEEVTETATNWSAKTMISVKNLIIGAIVVITLISVVSLLPSLFSGTTQSSQASALSESSEIATENVAPILSVGQQAINIYANAGDHFEILGIARNEDLVVTGTSEDGQWHRVSFDGQDGWIRSTSNANLQGNLGLVSVFSLPPTPTTTPMPTATFTASPTFTVTPSPTASPTFTATPSPTSYPIYEEDFEHPQLQLWNTTEGTTFQVIKDENDNHVWDVAAMGEMALNTGGQWTNYYLSLNFRLTQFANNENEEADVIAFKFRREIDFSIDCPRTAYEILYINNVMQAGITCDSPLGVAVQNQVRENVWQNLQIWVEDNQILWQLDNGTLNQTSSDLRSSGTIGIFAKPGSHGHIQFDNIRVWK